MVVSVFMEPKGGWKCTNYNHMESSSEEKKRSNILWSYEKVESYCKTHSKRVIYWTIIRSMIVIDYSIMYSMICRLLMMEYSSCIRSIILILRRTLSIYRNLRSKSRWDLMYWFRWDLIIFRHSTRSIRISIDILK